jgi:hypothetical protein
MITIAEWDWAWGSLLLAFAVLLLIGAGLEILAFDRAGWHAQFTFSATVRRWTHKQRWIAAVVPAIMVWIVFHFWIVPGV